MAHSHYVLDLFYPVRPGSDQLRREVLRIEAENDEVALAEGVRIDGWRKPQFYQVRAIRNSSRAGDKVLFTSQVPESDPVEAEVIVPQPADDSAKVDG